MKTSSEAWIGQVQKVLAQGANQNNTLELMSSEVSFDMNEPIMGYEKRNANYKFMLMEAHYILAGRNDIEYLGQAIKKFPSYSDDGYFQAGAYGPMFINQLPYVLGNLHDDDNTRQAVMTIWRPSPGLSKDIPCTLSLQWLIRDDKLHCVVNMRSSDIWTGLIYDMFCFTMMSQAILCLTEYADLTLGECFIHAGSSHLYEKDWKPAMDIVSVHGDRYDAMSIWEFDLGFDMLKEGLEVSHLSREDVNKALFA